MRELLDSFFSSLEKKAIEYGLHKTIRRINGADYKIKFLEINAKLLIAKASDVEEQLMNEERSGRKKRKREVETWLENVKVIENEFVILSNEELEEGFISWFLGGDESVHLTTMVIRLLEQSQHFGELALDEYEIKGKPLLTSEMLGKAFDEKLDRILECLVVDEVKTIGLYGMGGVGKTTLAEHIHNRLLNETHYSVYWITVSQEFSIKKLQDDIAKLIGLNLSDEENEDRRAAMLHRALSRLKKCVLILDDVWKDIDLKKIGDPIIVEGCRLIITTRSIEVCRGIGCQENIEVKPLEVDEAWNLFKANLGHFMELGPEVQEIAMLVAKQCGGLPLGIVTLAKTMRGVTSIHEWKNALAELKASCMTQLNNMEEKVFGVLQYSYDKLDPKLKPCLLYCCLYPEDHSISKFELISYFISEGLMDKRKSRSSQFDLGHAILDKLINHCLIEVKFGSLFVKMHDLVRDMALKIARNNQRFMVLAGLSLESIPKEEEWSKDLEKVSLMRNMITKFPLESAPNCPRLTTLLLNRNYYLDFIPESFFVHMRSLRILDLSFCRSMKELPNSLSDLESLNALILYECWKLKYVPHLGKLKVLTELNLSSTGVEKLPRDFVGVINWEVGGAVMKPSPPLKLSLFSYLGNLDIYKCEKIKKPGLPLACFQNITCIIVRKCAAIEEIIEVPENESGGIISLPNLSFLHLGSLPNLKSICNGATISCESIEIIMLKKCPNMKKLPLFLYCSEDQQISYPPPALRKIEVYEDDYEWWESLVWEQLSHKHALQPFVNFSSDIFYSPRIYL